MKVHYGFEEWQPEHRTTASLGNFDGVHLGHQRILKRTVELGRSLAIPSVAVTFDPVPKKVLTPDQAPLLIQTLGQRLRKMESLGLDHAVIVRFNQALARTKPEEFVDLYLVKKLGIQRFVVGENFSFGHQKSGNVPLLRQIGQRHDFEVEGLPEVYVDGNRVSSTLVREKIRAGDVEQASVYLGEPFGLEGAVIVGEKLGARLGIPTANLQFENELIPAHGVYITQALFDSGSYPSVTNVGVRPTIGGKRLVVETHLLQFSRNLYDQRLEVQFLQRLRDEKRFDSVEDLVSQIRVDIQKAENFFKRAPKP